MEIKTYHGERIIINYEPSLYKTKAGAAKALYKELCAACVGYGQDPAFEVGLQTPEESAALGYGKNWRVWWEAGPYEWAIAASFQIKNYPAGWYTEPYYSFDLCFAE